MQAVILAAGEGRRLRPFTVSEPKVMLPVGNRPILEHVVDAVVSAGVRSITLVVGYKKETIVSRFGNGKRYGCRIRYVTQSKQLGTAHALSLVDGLDEEFLLLSGDTFISRGLIRAFLSEWEQRGRKEHAMLLARSHIPSKYGVVMLKENFVHQIIEKPEVPTTTVVNTGIYIMHPTAMPVIHDAVERQRYLLTPAMQVLALREPMVGLFAKGIWADAVYPWDILKLNRLALKDLGESLAGTVEPGCRILGSVSIGEGTVIRANTYIEGPVSIGEECEIGPNVVITPSTSIGRDVVIEPNTFIRNSVLMDGVYVGALSQISYGVIGRGTHIGPHFSGSAGSTYIRSEDGFHEVNDIGPIIGEDVRIADNVVISPGAVLHARARVSSMKVVTKDVSEGAHVE